MQELIIKIKDRSNSILESMGFDAEPITGVKDGVVLINVQVENPAILIGKGGEGLEALEHILRLIFAQELYENRSNIVIDIAGYRDRKNERVKSLARERAYQVLSTGLEEILPPMSSYERRIAHMVCSNIADVETESTGEGKERRVVIKPKRVDK